MADDSFDVIVIGAGAAGLTAGALLAKAGKKVLLVEKAPVTGGLASPLVHGPYRFDVGPRLLPGCNADGPFGPGALHMLLERLGVAGDCEFIPVQPFVSIRLPGLTFPMWSGREAFVEGLKQASPTGLDDLPDLLDLCNRLCRSAMAVSVAGWRWNLLRMPLLRMPTVLPDLVRYGNATVADVLARYFPNRRARTAVEALWPYLGLEPSRVSFLLWAVVMATFIEEGAYFCRGGLGRLTDAVARAFVRDGGELRLNCEATGIQVSHGAVTGVELADGLVARAPRVVSTADPRRVFGALIDARHVRSSYRRKLGSLEPSHAGVALALVTDVGPATSGLGYETLIYDSWDGGQTRRTLATGEVGLLVVTVTTAVDPSLAPPGYHLVQAFSGLAPDARPSAEDRRRYGALLFSETRKHLPQLDGHLGFAADPHVPSGYLTHVFGPVYGWAASPPQIGLRRLSQHTPIKGLYLAGHWTRPAQGVMSAMLSGTAAAAFILNRGR